MMCMKCWRDAAPLSDGHYPGDWQTQVEGYERLLSERVGRNECAPEEQAGEFWDPVRKVDTRRETTDAK